MKKFLYLLLVLVAYQAEAQKGIIFKIKYLPSHTYVGDVTMDIKCNVNLSGDQQILDQLSSQGMTQPLSLNLAMKMGAGIKTGSPGPNHIFPLTMNYKLDSMNVSLNGKSFPIPAIPNSNAIIYGHVGTDGKLSADSIGGGNLKDTSKQKITEMMNVFQNKIKFPDHPMHVGETFVQDMPFNLPGIGDKMAISAKATYKLVNITGGKAYFDVEQNMNLSIPIKGESITLTGTGGGKLVYDIKNSFPVDYKTDIILKFEGKIKTIQINGTASMDIDFKYVIN